MSYKKNKKHQPKTIEIKTKDGGVLHLNPKYYTVVAGRVVRNFDFQTVGYTDARFT